MRFFTKGLMVLAVGVMVASCSPLSRSSKAIVVDDDGRSMRFNNGRQESRNKKWNSTKGIGKQQKKRNKRFSKRKRG